MSTGKKMKEIGTNSKNKEREVIERRVISELDEINKRQL